MSLYREKLLKAVIEKSESKKWELAVLEWIIADVEEDENLKSSCVCGKEHLRYLYTIHNEKTGEYIFPIGSQSIKKFGRSDLDEYTTITESMFKLLHAIRNNEFIELTADYFSRKLVLDLYNRGVFEPNNYNYYNGYNDYQFLLKMFNKRDKTLISFSQKRKIRGIIAYTIRPWLEGKLGSKIRKKV